VQGDAARRVRLRGEGRNPVPDQAVPVLFGSDLPRSCCAVCRDRADSGPACLPPPARLMPLSRGTEASSRVRCDSTTGPFKKGCGARAAANQSGMGPTAETLRRAATAARGTRSWKPKKGCSCHSCRERLAPHVREVAADLRPCVQHEHAVVRPRHVARPRHLAAPDQSHLGDGVMWGAARPRGDDRGASAGAAGDAMDARGLEGFGEAHRGQDGGQPARQHRLARPRGPRRSHIMVTTPA
jgi:hypothetical protein